MSHIDCAPTILEAAGVPPRVGGRALPGASLFALADGASPQRPVISEYHAIGSLAGAFMLRFGKWKYCHYVGVPPQLFDLEADPEELVDLAGDARFAATLAEGERLLRAALDPEAKSTRAQSGARPSCSRSSAAARRRSRAATWASRRRPAPPPRSTSPAVQPRALWRWRAVNPVTPIPAGARRPPACADPRLSGDGCTMPATASTFRRPCNKITAAHIAGLTRHSARRTLPTGM